MTKLICCTVYYIAYENKEYIYKYNKDSICWNEGRKQGKEEMPREGLNTY